MPNKKTVQKALYRETIGSAFALWGTTLILLFASVPRSSSTDRLNHS